MRQKSALGLVGVFALAGWGAIAACGSSDFSADTNDGGGSVIDPNCDLTQLPSQNACVLEEQGGIFVSGVANGGSDDGDGSRAHPLATITKGLVTAKAAKKRVYVCIGEYAEQITLLDGVSIFGDLDCANAWKPVLTHASLKSPASPALRADQIQSATRIEGIDVSAPDGTAASRSSIGLIATGSPGLTVANATILAGNGFNGEDGVDGVQLSEVGSPNGSQNPPNSSCETAAICPPNGTGTTGSTCDYPDGGLANNGAWNGGPGGAGGTGGACLVSGGCMVNGVPLACCTTVDYGPGPGGAAPGTSGQPGALGTSGANAPPGQLSAAGYTPADGTPGANGGPGTGGNGTGGADAPPTKGHSASGIGGGAGGCPGLAGTGGKGGGASIAVLTIDSASTFDTCILQSSNGGAAGKGAFGSDPTPGGTGGVHGGAGGESGWSGNGGAGPAYGIASHGAVALLKLTTPKAGKGGAGVPTQTHLDKTIPATSDGASNADFTF